jgi:hypothetical protein
MIVKTTVYFDSDEMNAKEAYFAATSACKHRPEQSEAYTHQTVLPNGKRIEVDCNAALTQIRCARVPK